VTETELVTWLSSTDEAPTTQSVTGSEIIDIVLNQIDNSDTESDEEGENVTYDEGIALGYKYLNFLPKQNCITEQELMTVHRLQENRLKKSKIFKQQTIDSIF
jgi:hypothetical protein